MKPIFLTATAALLIFAASCGQNAPTQKPEVSEEAQQKVTSAMSDEQFSTLITEVYYKLPESVMPNDLKTEKQRKEKLDSDEPRSTEFINCIWHLSYDCTEWNMAGYLTTDQQNVVVIIFTRGCFEGACETFEDKTLNYNVETKKFTEISRPIEPITTQELFDQMVIDNAEIKNHAKDYYDKTQELFYQFDRDGFTAKAELSMFWLGEIEGVFEYYYEHYDRDKEKPVYRKWNGSMFVKRDKEIKR